MAESSSIAAAARFSSRCAGVRVLGIGTASWWTSQASAASPLVAVFAAVVRELAG